VKKAPINTANTKEAKIPAANKAKARRLAALHALFALYSAAGILSKLAAGRAFMSGPFLLFYGGALAVLFVYALIWQQMLKGIALSVAYSSKAVTVAWGLLWGALLFKEDVTPKKLLGAAMAAAGVFCVTTGAKAARYKDGRNSPAREG